ncbi:MAG: translation elongation factor 4 [Planctomycetota bacterium]|jgi:GTP-binding protein LepA|nr:translation elongation factor 4 [Planctomycetota bacterium]MDP7248233.1 translation elongation factor 4 [Planctomycetota bacterium]
MSKEHIRNFCIIAHVDHGKSTLADRFLLRTGSITERDFQNQALDTLDIERERGITIKAVPVQLDFEQEGKKYKLHLIDTPGHVDFSYEVTRSLSACEGAILLVDASQGVEAQTVANAYHAIEQDLTIVPVLNKIDLPSSRPEEVMEEMEGALGIDFTECLLTSAKTGEGVNEVLAAIIDRVPTPEGDDDEPLQALVFDSVYNDYRGVVLYVRLKNGVLRLGDTMQLVRSQQKYEVTEIGTFRPSMVRGEELRAGEVGYVCAQIKSIHDVKVGDTIIHSGSEVEPLPGYVEPMPMVYCGLYPGDSQNFEDLRDALDKFHLQDSSFTFDPESSGALGFGFRCGFLGLLHMSVVQERLEKEYDIDLVQTAPNVTYEILKTDGTTLLVRSPAELPDTGAIQEFREPMVDASILVPAESIGNVMKLGEERRGEYKSTEYLGSHRAILHYRLPLSEIIFDFYDKLKSSTRGYGTMDYVFIGYHQDNLVKVDVMVAGTKLDALAVICHRSKSDKRGRALIQKLRKEIPRHMFEVALQAAVGAKVIARENIKALAKNVTAKCYGGDVTRKRKLLEKQKEGKKRMKSVGNVTVPQEAFLAVLAPEED